ncbi:MAG TPA: cytochrome c oxidase assembly protein [Chloroflexia bacterium]|nr:cytochrome c oxidase assembly protein [Chloroflexia bacterium]
MAYGIVVQFHFTGRAIYYLIAVLSLLAALVSPLDELSDYYLFSAHMVQHLLLVLVFPPCFLLGIPPRVWKRLLKWEPARRVERVLSIPLLAWFIGVGSMWLWHLPPLYNAALASETVHILEHLTLMVAAVIFWWVVLAPSKYRRLQPFASMVYLFPASVFTAVLGILLTFWPDVLYPAYLHPVDKLQLLSLIRDQWGISAKADQSVGGALMWSLGGLAYLGGMLGMLARWYKEQEADYQQMVEEEYATTTNGKLRTGALAPREEA